MSRRGADRDADRDAARCLHVADGGDDRAALRAPSRQVGRDAREILERWDAERSSLRRRRRRPFACGGGTDAPTSARAAANVLATTALP